MSETRISLKKQELIDIVNIINTIKNENDFYFEIIETNNSGLGSIISIECDIEFNGIKGKFQTIISGVETW